MISCSEAVRQLWEYLDASVGGADHEAIDAHLEFCRRCCGELEFARELRRLLEVRPAGQLPGEVQGRLERFLGGLVEQPPVDPGGEVSGVGSEG